jgi:hypothetical protein
MAAEYQGQDPMVIAKQAERDLNSQKAPLSDSSKSSSTQRTPQPNLVETTTNISPSTAQDSGVNENVEAKFPGAEVKIGGQGSSDNRQIPVSEGGSIDPTTGKQTKASDFEGVGGPEDKAAIDREVRGGDNDIRDNIRQGGSTVRPAGSMSNNAAGGAGKSTQ